MKLQRADGSPPGADIAAALQVSVDSFEALRDRTRAWTQRAERAKRKIIW